MTTPRCSRRCECPDCLIGKGEFCGTASTAIAGFTEYSGSWETDGLCNLVGGGPGTIRFDTPHPEGLAGKQNLLVKFKFPTEATVAVAVVQQNGGYDEFQTCYADDITPDFTLTYDGQTTSTLTFTSTAADVTAALEALSNIGSGNVICVERQVLNAHLVAFQIAFTRTAGPQTTQAGDLSLMDLPEMVRTPTTVDLYNITVRDGSYVACKQRVQLHNASGGTFTLTFDGQTTGTIAWNASAATVQTALEALSNIAPGDINVVLNATSDWTVEFLGFYGSVPVMTGDGSGLTFTPITGLVRVRGLVGLEDADNYLAAEVYLDDSGCSYLKLYKVSGGSDTQLGDDQPIPAGYYGTSIILRVCWAPGLASGSGGSSGNGTLRASVTDLSGAELAYGNQANTTAIGLYTGLSIETSSSILFWDFYYKYMGDILGDPVIHCSECNTPCPISRDNFSDSAKSACLWSGSFSVSGGKMNTTGRTKHLVFGPQLKSTMVATANVLDGASISVKMTINDDDAGAALEAVYETDADSRTLTIYRDGVELDTTTEDDVTFPGTPVETVFEICFDGHTLSAECGGLCVLQATSEIPGGKWASLDGTGTWDNYTLGKTKSLADPPDRCERCGCVRPAVCTDCCGGNVLDNAYLVDLGSGTWHWRPCDTNPFNTSSCLACEHAQGEFIVEATAELACSWTYVRYDDCDWGYCCGLGAPGWVFGILLALYKDGPSDPRPGFCRWMAVVTMESDYLGCDGGVQCIDDDGVTLLHSGSRQSVAYSSDYLEDPNRQDKCDDLPITLTKVPYGECAGSTSIFCTNGLCPCRGDLPDTITVSKIV